MTATRKRKCDKPTVDSAKFTRLDSASSKAVTKIPKRVNTIFDKYSNKISGLIEKLKAEMQGYFTLDEWQKGLMALHVDSFTKLKKTLLQLEEEVLMPENFEDFYIFAFRYHLTDERQKILDLETICILLDLILKSRYQQQVTSFIDYLKINSDYKAMNKDQWIGFYRFCKEISFPDLQNYDSAEAWPILLDNFVEWLRERSLHESGSHSNPVQDL